MWPLYHAAHGMTILLSCLNGRKRSELLGWLLPPPRLNVLILSSKPIVEILSSELTEPDQFRPNHMLVSHKKCLMNLLCYSLVFKSQTESCVSSFSLLIKKKTHLVSPDSPKNLLCCLPNPGLSQLFCELGQLN